MAMVVKNNMAAVRTLNTLNSNSSALQKSLAKVSSGMRINSAQDDASGYAISERMRVQIRALDQANQNTQNGSSLMKTAEGAVSSTIEILKTLKEKAINAATDTNTDDDRATIQKEINQFVDQIDDNALVTFNGKYLLEGSKTQSGNATKTAFTNQQLSKTTDGETALTALKNRNDEDLNIASTDKVTASFVKDGKTYTTTFQVSDTKLEDIFSKLNETYTGSVETTKLDQNGLTEEEWLAAADTNTSANFATTNARESYSYGGKTYAGLNNANSEAAAAAVTGALDATTLASAISAGSTAYVADGGTIFTSLNSTDAIKYTVENIADEDKKAAALKALADVGLYVDDATAKEAAQSAQSANNVFGAANLSGVPADTLKDALNAATEAAYNAVTGVPGRPMTVTDSATAWATVKAADDASMKAVVTNAADIETYLDGLTDTDTKASMTALVDSLKYLYTRDNNGATVTAGDSTALIVAQRSADSAALVTAITNAVVSADAAQAYNATANTYDVKWTGANGSENSGFHVGAGGWTETTIEPADKAGKGGALQLFQDISDAVDNYAKGTGTGSNAADAGQAAGVITATVAAVSSGLQAISVDGHTTVANLQSLGAADPTVHDFANTEFIFYAAKSLYDADKPVAVEYTTANTVTASTNIADSDTSGKYRLTGDEFAANKTAAGITGTLNSDAAVSDVATAIANAINTATGADATKGYYVKTDASNLAEALKALKETVGTKDATNNSLDKFTANQTKVDAAIHLYNHANAMLYDKQEKAAADALEAAKQDAADRVAAAYGSLTGDPGSAIDIDVLDKGDTGINDAVTAAAYEAFSAGVAGGDVSLVHAGADIGLGASNDIVKTADETEGLTVTAANSGLKGQVAGLTISVADSEGNVRKAVNTYVNAFNTTIFAANEAKEDHSLKLHVGATANQSISVGLADMRSDALGLKGSDGTVINVTTQANANAAVAAFDNAIAKALDQSTTIGAIEARLEYTSSNLTTSAENTQAAESAIRDADMAKEMTTYTKNNVLLQAAQSMLAQANQNASAVLSLLQ